MLKTIFCFFLIAGFGQPSRAEISSDEREYYFKQSIQNYYGGLKGWKSSEYLYLNPFAFERTVLEMMCIVNQSWLLCQFLNELQEAERVYYQKMETFYNIDHELIQKASEIDSHLKGICDQGGFKPYMEVACQYFKKLEDIPKTIEDIESEVRDAREEIRDFKDRSWGSDEEIKKDVARYMDDELEDVEEGMRGIERLMGEQAKLKREWFVLSSMIMEVACHLKEGPEDICALIDQFNAWNLALHQSKRELGQATKLVLKEIYSLCENKERQANAYYPVLCEDQKIEILTKQMEEWSLQDREKASS